MTQDVEALVVVRQAPAVFLVFATQTVAVADAVLETVPE
jgi:hypothetical protein